MEENKNKKGKLLIALVVAVIVLLLVVVGLLVAMLLKKDTPTTTTESHTTTEEKLASGLKYESNLALDEDSFQDMVDAMVEKAEEGYISLDYKNSAISEDGIHFSCGLFNSINNRYDCYFDLYTDATFEKELYVSGLIAPGNGIDNFTLDEALAPGTYTCVLAQTQVADDHTTLMGQVFVELTLSVQ